MPKTELVPVCYLVAWLKDGAKVLTIPFRRFKPDSGWLLGVEYEYQSRYSRYRFFDRQGQLIAAQNRTKSLTFATPEDAHRFFDNWLQTKQVDLGSLDFGKLVEAAQKGYDPAAVRHAGVKAIADFVERMPDWAVSTRAAGESWGLDREGKNLVQVWETTFHTLGVYEDGSWRWAVYNPFDGDGIVGEGISAEDLAASWDRCISTPIFEDRP